MPDFIIAYHGGKRPNTPEEGAEHMAKFGVWIGDLGDAVVNPGTPLGTSKTIISGGLSEDTGSNRLTGYSIVKADSMDAALEMAKGCPHLDIGSLEVAQVMHMSN